MPPTIFTAGKKRQAFSYKSPSRSEIDVLAEPTNTALLLSLYHHDYYTTTLEEKIQ